MSMVLKISLAVSKPAEAAPPGATRVRLTPPEAVPPLE